MLLLICDDHRVLVDSLSELLEARGHAVLRAMSPADAVRVAGEAHPDACVLDAGFPDANGVEVIAELKRTSDTTSVILLTGNSDPSLHEEALRRGASFCATKADDLDTFVAMLESLPVNGDVVQRSAMTARTSDPASTFDTHPLARFLTSRERDVLVGLVTGESTSSLGARLEIGPATVRTHIQSILTKLGVHSRLEAVAFAIRERLVTPAIFPATHDRGYGASGTTRLA